jgi:hypothetical protein
MVQVGRRDEFSRDGDLPFHFSDGGNVRNVIRAGGGVKGLK